MPQLNPAPWLLIMITSWMVLLTLFAPKITSTLPQDAPLSHNQAPNKTTPWSWPWT